MLPESIVGSQAPCGRSGGGHHSQARSVSSVKPTASGPKSRTDHGQPRDCGLLAGQLHGVGCLVLGNLTVQCPHAAGVRAEGSHHTLQHAIADHDLYGTAPPTSSRHRTRPKLPIGSCCASTRAGNLASPIQRGKMRDRSCGSRPDPHRRRAVEVAVDQEARDRDGAASGGDRVGLAAEKVPVRCGRNRGGRCVRSR